MKNKTKFSEYMSLLCEIHSREISITLAEVYWRILRPYPDQACIKAFEKFIRSDYFPKPKDLLSAIGEDNGIAAWEEVMNHLERGTRSENHKINRVIKILGGWDYIETQTFDSLRWIEKRFLEFYKALPEIVETKQLQEGKTGKLLSQICDLTQDV